MLPNSKKFRFIGVFTIGILLGIIISLNCDNSIKKPFLDFKTTVFELFKPNSFWGSDFELVTISSSIDKNPQKAYLFSAVGMDPRPLIVSLHTWGGDYKETDSLALFCKAYNINYIRPNFRGANSKPEACGSDLSIKDIDDAMDFCISKTNVDLNKIHVIGKSGGGYAAINTYMKSKHDVNTISAWVPITDLAKWYEEGLVRKSSYTKDILNCTNSKNNQLNRNEALKRSPMSWPTPQKNTKLYIYAGVYDGVTGSVPISHSINFYNKILLDHSCPDSTKYITDREKLLLLSNHKPLGHFGEIEDRKIILKKEYKKNKIVIFEGGHEMLTNYAFQELLEQ